MYFNIFYIVYGRLSEIKHYILYNSLKFSSAKSARIVFKPNKFRLHYPTMFINMVGMQHLCHDSKYDMTMHHYELYVHIT